MSTYLFRNTTRTTHPKIRTSNKAPPAGTKMMVTMRTELVDISSMNRSGAEVANSFDVFNAVKDRAKFTIKRYTGLLNVKTQQP